MRFTDSHCHLNYCHAPEAAAVAARQAGVQRIVIPAVGVDGWAAVKRCAAIQGVFAAYGIHPLSALQMPVADALHLLENRLRQESAIAVGECGLDFCAGICQVQYLVFIGQLDIAKRLHLPVLVHARKSLDTVLQCIRKAGMPRFVIHAFSGSDVQLTRVLASGGYIGIGGTSTYPRAQRLRRQIAALASERYLLETDAPDQPLYHARDRENTPERIVDIARNLAQLRGQTLADISRQSEANCRDFFAR